MYTAGLCALAFFLPARRLPAHSAGRTPRRAPAEPKSTQGVFGMGNAGKAAVCAAGRKIWAFVRGDAVLSVSIVLAVVSMFFVPPRPGLRRLYRLGHARPAFQPDGRGEGLPERGLFRIHRQRTAEAHAVHPLHGGRSGFPALFLQHRHHQRRFPDHFRALRRLRTCAWRVRRRSPFR